MRWLLLAAVLGLLYPYLLYPLILAGVTRFFARPVKASGELPSVAILVSAFNEESKIGLKISNFEALEYPKELLELWIGTDGSADNTAGHIRGLNHPRVHLVERATRSGKTAVLNDLAARAKADVLIFTDANASFRPDTVRRLIGPLTDPQVGLVSGRVLVRLGAGNFEVEGAYYKIDSWMKEQEGHCGWLGGALGPIYAMKRSLYRELPADLINDLAHPCQVVAQGFQARFEPLAISEEAAGDHGGREFDRQTRIAAQASYLLTRQLWPLVRNGRWGMVWVLCSHKWSRWIAGIWVPTGLIALYFLSPPLSFVAVALIALFIIGWRFGARWAGIPVFFLIVHSAYLNGLWRALCGERFVTWKPRAG